VSIFEIIMLICFGSAWPFSIYKSYKSGSNRGKSVLFLIIVFIGYVMGMLHKIYYSNDLVIYLYVFNSLMVATDMILYYRNNQIDSQKSC